MLGVVGLVTHPCGENSAQSHRRVVQGFVFFWRVYVGHPPGPSNHRPAPCGNYHESSQSEEALQGAVNGRGAMMGLGLGLDAIHPYREVRMGEIRLKCHV